MRKALGSGRSVGMADYKKRIEDAFRYFGDHVEFHDIELDEDESIIDNPRILVNAYDNALSGLRSFVNARMNHGNGFQAHLDVLSDEDLGNGRLHYSIQVIVDKGLSERDRESALNKYLASLAGEVKNFRMSGKNKFLRKI